MPDASTHYFYSLESVLGNLGSLEKEHPDLILTEFTLKGPDTPLYTGDFCDMGFENTDLHLASLIDPADITAIADLFETTPLYFLNMQLLLEKILVASETDKPLRTIVTTAFDIKSDLIKPRQDDVASGHEDTTLTYSILDHIAQPKLVGIYLKTLHAMSDIKHPLYKDVAFFAVIKPNPRAFLDLYDGYVLKNHGVVRLSSAIPTSIRLNDTDQEDMSENYAQLGHDAAMSMAFENDEDLLQAWVSAEDYQCKLCRQIDTLLKVMPLSKTPRWLRKDVLNLLNREAMKQVFAQRLEQSAQKSDIFNKNKNLREISKLYSKDHVDPHLQKLMGETLSPSKNYSGAAEAFILDAKRRKKSLSA